MHMWFLPTLVMVAFVSLILHSQTASKAQKAADVYLQCPAKWPRDEEVTLTCRINAARFTQSVCTAQRSDVADFMFSTPEGFSSSRCHVSNFTTSCLKTSSQCGCKSLSGGVYELFYNLKALTEYEGGSWKCDVTCLDDTLTNQLVFNASVGCSPVTVVNATEISDATSPAVPPSSNGAADSRVGVIAGSVVGALALVISPLKATTRA